MERLGSLIFDVIAGGLNSDEAMITTHSDILNACLDAFFDDLFKDAD